MISALFLAAAAASAGQSTPGPYSEFEKQCFEAGAIPRRINKGDTKGVAIVDSAIPVMIFMFADPNNNGFGPNFTIDNAGDTDGVALRPGQVLFKTGKQLVYRGSGENTSVCVGVKLLPTTSPSTNGRGR